MGLNNPLLVRIKAAGEPLKLGLGGRVLKFEYEDVEKGDDMLKMVFADPFHELLDSDQFKENTEWTVQWGFPEKMAPARTVLVKRPRLKYGEIEIEALDKGSSLRLSENWGTEKNTTHAQIIQKIASKNKLRAVLDQGLETVVPFFSYGGMTDYDVLKYIQSQAEDHVFKILNDQLIFRKRRLDSPPVGTFPFQPGPDSRLLEFEVVIKDQDNARSAKQTTAVAIDPMTHKKVVSKADESNTPTTNLGNRRPLDNYLPAFAAGIPSISSLIGRGGRAQATTKQGDTTGKSLVLPPRPEAEMDKVAKGKHRKHKQDCVEAKFEILADPSDPFFKSGDIIEVRGIGNKCSGKYQIVKISHDLTNGYRYKIEGKRNAVNTPQKKKNSPRAVKEEVNGKQNLKEILDRGAQELGMDITNTRTGAVVP